MSLEDSGDESPAPKGMVKAARGKARAVAARRKGG